MNVLQTFEVRGNVGARQDLPIK